MLVYATNPNTRAFVVYCLDAMSGIYRDPTGYVGLFQMTQTDLREVMSGTTYMQGRPIKLRDCNRIQTNMIVQELKKRQLRELEGPLAVKMLKVLDL